jgi:hypothetical protein
LIDLEPAAYGTQPPADEGLARLQEDRQPPSVPAAARSSKVGEHRPLPWH